MSTIVSKEGKCARKVQRASFGEELELQKYIEDNPESIPAEDMKKDAKMLILGREFSIETGSIDALGIDQDGDIYIVETSCTKIRTKGML